MCYCPTGHPPTWVSCTAAGRVVLCACLQSIRAVVAVAVRCSAVVVLVWWWWWCDQSTPVASTSGCQGMHVHGLRATHSQFCRLWMPAAPSAVRTAWVGLILFVCAWRRPCCLCCVCPAMCVVVCCCWRGLAPVPQPDMGSILMCNSDTVGRCLPVLTRPDGLVGLASFLGKLAGYQTHHCLCLTATYTPRRAPKISPLQAVLGWLVQTSIEGCLRVGSLLELGQRTTGCLPTVLNVVVTTSVWCSCRL